MPSLYKKYIKKKKTILNFNFSQITQQSLKFKTNSPRPTVELKQPSLIDPFIADQTQQPAPQASEPSCHWTRRSRLQPRKPSRHQQRNERSTSNLHCPHAMRQQRPANPTPATRTHATRTSSKPSSTRP